MNEKQKALATFMIIGMECYVNDPLDANMPIQEWKTVLLCKSSCLQ